MNKHLHMNIAVGKLPERELLQVTLLLILSNCPLKSLHQFATHQRSPRSLLSGRHHAGRMCMEEGTKNVLCHPLTHPQSIVAAILRVLGCWVHWRWEHSCAFFQKGHLSELRLFLVAQWHTPCFSRGFLASRNSDPFVAEHLAVLSILMSVPEPILLVDRLFSSKNCGCKPPKLESYTLLFVWEGYMGKPCFFFSF